MPYPVMSLTVIGATNVDGTCLFAIGAVTFTTGVIIATGPPDPSIRSAISNISSVLEDSHDKPGDDAWAEGDGMMKRERTPRTIRPSKWNLQTSLRRQIDLEPRPSNILLLLI